MPLEDQPTAQPSNKLVTGTLGGSFGTAVYVMASMKLSFLKEPELQLALMPVVVAVFTLGPAWFKRNLEAYSQMQHANRNWWVTIGGVVAIAAIGASLGAWVF